MDLVKQFRENTRQLECHLGNMNQADCCCCGVSTTQCFIIVEIGRKPGISVKELAEILRIDKSGVSRAVEELVQKGFVERNPSKEDRRYVVLNLLPKGQARFEKIENDMYIKFKEVLEQIPAEKQEQVIEALRLYNEACTKVEAQ
ncbi:MAG: winged helix-turn-helix transcriptional regulator [Lachnospiraceae bacterium]|nr:winged helix-turn-helix transcriptional regulator [Lachnospiraceae bacterium]